MFLVSGITGNVGGATARKLLSSGHSVRALVRNPDKAAAWANQGVELYPADFTDTESIATALKGVEGVFLMIPPTMTPGPGFPEAKAVISSYVDALRQSPPPRLVLLSSIGSEKSSGLGLITSTHLLEEALGDLPFPTAFVRAAGFLENHLYSLDTAAATGVFYTMMQPTDHPFPMVATVDIGNEVARLLVDGWTGNKIVELGSRVTLDEVANAMGEVLGKPVHAQAVPREQWSSALAQLGFPAGTTAMYEEMTDAVNSGWIDFGVPGTEPVAGTTTAKEVFEKAIKRKGESGSSS